MEDSCQRSIDYLRVSVTDRCNFRCRYCMPAAGVHSLAHEDILSYEEMLRVVAAGVRLGVRRVRLTGGEPLVRKGLPGFVARLAALPGVEDLALTTNGSLLTAALARQLKEAGLRRVNISLDTARSEGFRRLTRTGEVAAVLRGLDQAREAGLQPVKVNVVLTEYLVAEDLAFFLQLSREQQVAVRFIEYMPIGAGSLRPRWQVEEVRRRLEELAGGALAPLEGVCGGGPAVYWQAPGDGVFGFITPLSHHFCGTCNRMRLTADGRLRPCLLDKREVDVRAALRRGAGEEELLELFRQAVRSKPAGHGLAPGQGGAFGRRMSQIGG